MSDLETKRLCWQAEDWEVVEVSKVEAEVKVTLLAMAMLLQPLIGPPVHKNNNIIMLIILKILMLLIMMIVNTTSIVMMQAPYLGWNWFVEYPTGITQKIFDSLSQVSTVWLGFSELT